MSEHFPQNLSCVSHDKEESRFKTSTKSSCGAMNPDGLWVHFQRTSIISSVVCLNTAMHDGLPLPFKIQFKYFIANNKKESSIVSHNPLNIVK